MNDANEQQPQGLKIYIVFNNPEDMPGRVVVRGATVGVSSDPDNPQVWDIIASVFPSVLAAREAKPAHLHTMPRHPTDPLAIVEMWV